VYGIDGRLVKELVNGRLAEGEHRLVWNAEGLPTGVYFIKLTHADKALNQKIVFLR
jgi:hypothetical protein